MARSKVPNTNGTGDTNWDTFARVYDGVTTVQELYVQRSEPANATYDAVATLVLTTTGTDHLLALAGDGINYTRLKQISVEQSLGSTAGLADLRLYRTSSLPVVGGGTTIVPRPRDTSDAAYGGACISRPGTKGTEGVQLLQKRLYLVSTAAIGAQPNRWDWYAHEDDGLKPIIIGPATTDGIALKIVSGLSGSEVDVTFTFTVDSSL